MILDMDRDEVPHFCQDVPPGTDPGHALHLQSEEWEREWLANLDIARVVVPHSPEADVWTLAEQYHRLAPDAAVMLMCSLYGGMNHEVVLYRGRLYDPLSGVHDTDHTPGTQRYQPSTDGLYWVTILARATNTLTQATDPANVVSERTDT